MQPVGMQLIVMCRGQMPEQMPMIPGQTLMGSPREENNFLESLASGSVLSKDGYLP